jgi:MbtH protein
MSLLAVVAVLTFGQALAAGEGPAEKGEKYRVVINHEEQYSIWLADRELPKGWKATDFVGTQKASLDHIEEVWTDMRPLEKRRATALEIYGKLRSSAVSSSAAGAPKYRVVINHEEQYSIWSADRRLPAGWKSTDFVGTQKESLDHIEEVWTDMRPLAKRRELALEIYKKLQSKK